MLSRSLDQVGLGVEGGGSRRGSLVQRRGSIKFDCTAVASALSKPTEIEASPFTATARRGSVVAGQGTFLTSGSAPSGGYNVYAVNYNVLRIMSGMGGLAYSN